MIMTVRRIAMLSLICAFPLLATTAQAQDFTDFRSDKSRMQGDGVAPEDSARPGESFFYKAARAESKGDTRFATNMFRVSASWAYKPAQYNLGVMYFNGEGVAQDKALGMAWLALAAERSEDRDYARARDSAYAQMSDEEFARANVLWREMRGTYSDAIALKRARNRWIQVRNGRTGSHLGANTGPVLVGGRNKFGRNTALGGSALTESHYGFGVTGPGAIDASIAYRQLLESDDPYDVKFKQEKGTVTVEDVIPIGDGVQRPPQRKQFLFI
jgi:hypothetical protein